MNKKRHAQEVSAETAPAAPKTRTKPLLRALSGETLTPPPLWLMRQAGRYLPEYRALRRTAGGFLDFCFTPELAVEATLQPIRRYEFDAAILFSDILVVPHALGQKVWFEEGRGPRLEALADAADLDRLQGEALVEALRPVYETLEELGPRLPQQTALIGFAGAPWTVATYMLEGGSSRDFARAKHWMAKRPQDFARLMELLAKATFDHLSAQVAAGAEVLQIFDSWAGALSLDDMLRWSLEPLSEIIRRLKAAHPDVPVILFPRAAGEVYRDFARESGADALSLDQSVPLPWAREELQSRVAVQGNLDPQTLVAGGGRLDDEVRRILDALGQGPFVFNLGHGIPPETPPDNVARLVRIVRETGG
jgi:uroporphyrinogen decarboxylase